MQSNRQSNRQCNQMGRIRGDARDPCALRSLCSDTRESQKLRSLALDVFTLHARTHTKHTHRAHAPILPCEEQRAFGFVVGVFLSWLPWLAASPCLSACHSCLSLFPPSIPLSLPFSPSLLLLHRPSSSISISVRILFLFFFIPTRLATRILSPPYLGLSSTLSLSLPRLSLSLPLSPSVQERLCLNHPTSRPSSSSTHLLAFSFSQRATLSQSFSLLPQVPLVQPTEARR